MPVSTVCRTCGKKLKIPDGFDRARCRCPRCQTKVALGVSDTSLVVSAPPVTRTAAPQPLASLPPESLPPESVAPDPAPKPLSLDADRPPPRPGPPRPLPPGAPRPAAYFPPPPPPVAFTVRVLDDSRNQIAGRLAATLVPAGLALTRGGKPVLAVPVGTRAEAAGFGGDIVLKLPGRTVELRVGGVGHPQRLAADAADVLTGAPFDLNRADYRTPFWVPLAAVGLAGGLAIGPATLGESTALGWLGGLILGAVFAVAALFFNLLIGYGTRLPMGVRGVLMGGMSGALLVVFLLGSTAYLKYDQTRREKELAAATPPTAPAPPPATTPDPPPPVTPPPEEVRRFPTYADTARKEGVVRLDGPAEVVAVGVVPGQGSVLVCYANTTTAVWPVSLPEIEPPGRGPTAAGPARRLDFTPAGFAAFATTNGTVVTPVTKPPASPMKFAGDMLAFHTTRPVFAAARGKAVTLKNLPEGLVRAPAGRSGGGVTVPGQKQEKEMTYAGLKADFNAPQPPTFLAWHPNGKVVLVGQPAGETLAWNPDGFVPKKATGPKADAIYRDHKTAVRAWAAGASGDLVTGDGAGVVAVWTKAKGEPAFVQKVLPFAVARVALSPTGGYLAAAADDGTLAVWDLDFEEEVFTTKRPAPIKALAFGPEDDLLLLANGTATELWSLKALGEAVGRK